MNLNDALTYQDSLDTVAGGTANSVQVTEVEAVIFGLRQYLDGLALKVGEFKAVYANLTLLGPDRAKIIQAAIDGADPLPAARVFLDDAGSNVVVAADIPAPIQTTPPVTEPPVGVPST